MESAQEMSEPAQSMPPDLNIGPDRVVVLSVSAIVLIAAGLAVMVWSERSSAANVAAVIRIGDSALQETIDARLRWTARLTVVASRPNADRK